MKTAMVTPKTWMLASPTSAMMRARSPTDRSARKNVVPITKRANARIAYRILFRIDSRNVLAAMEKTLVPIGRTSAHALHEDVLEAFPDGDARKDRRARRPEPVDQPVGVLGVRRADDDRVALGRHRLRGHPLRGEPFRARAGGKHQLHVLDLPPHELVHRPLRHLPSPVKDDDPVGKRLDV